MNAVLRPLACAIVLLLPACDSASTDAKSEPAKAGKAEAKGDAKSPAKAEAKTTETKAAPEAKVEEAKTEAKAEAKAEPAASGPDPCALVSRARAGEALRSPVEEGVRSGNTCTWKATTGPGSVTIQITDGDGANVYTREKQLLGSSQDLADLGTAAFSSGNIVGVHAGDRYVSIGVAPNIGQGPMARPSDAVALARDAIAALPR